ncbi:signal transduction histidine kinase/ActR/RegA family two-component response regulator [Bradyrhizobium diazoefficiens]|uniref:histidine kinase n=1 Tax=Bradyrhizobium diazoefficiens TaxID=1355477 RepID=A0A0E4BT84_9BRAD|nr:ATP-binding protein [Bradyrhizobium diazoefficiens]MBR0860991.1 response regulator [Bradyrhizobium diazoefficiens]MBR0885346.1 response regulator [Bradyrhizobium diazoefficiens]MBR0917239.1 response regulator [Bradyrhizobium diazoefficiens]BAR60164.1 two-component hybrid sensor and regulator [Bradyrhizobium diazoefficiens]
MDSGASTANRSLSVAGVLIAFGIGSVFLLGAGRQNYPELHTILDTSITLITGLLALLLWDMGARIEQPLSKRLAIAFGATFVLEFLHVLVIVEWSGSLAFVMQLREFLRPATWPPAAHILAIGILAAIWSARRDRVGMPAFALFMAVVAVLLIAIFQRLPPYRPPGLLDITRPVLIVAPLLWAITCVLCWRLRATDRIFGPLALMGAVVLLGHVAMLYSQAPHDTEAMVAHLGKVAGRLVLLLSMMRMASSDMLERMRAEAQLARLNEELEVRVEERTAQLAASNLALESEILVRRHAEQKAQAQLARLSLLHQITRAIGERQDLNSIFQVVVRSLEDQLPVDFGCLCFHDAVDHVLTVECVGIKSGALAMELAMPERSRIDIDENGLSRCVMGQLVYEPDITRSSFPFPVRLARGGLRAMVLAPLQVESRVFGVLVAARKERDSFSSGECEFLRQLSEHVALAAHQAQLHGALQQAYEDLRQTQQAVMQQERLRALGQMASGIAHDINNALSPVSLYTQSLLEREPGLSARTRDYLETIQRAVEDVAYTVARMREFYRQREPQLTLMPVHLNQLVQQVVDLTRARWSDMPQLRGTVIALRTELAEQLPAISGIESEIREALINLIFNAVDAVPGGGTLTLRTRLAGGADGHGQVRVEVGDDGLGMDEETRRRCLEPFFTTKGERGTGLGLAMVYGVLRRHNGEIEIDSAVGRGTIVSLNFPVPQAAPATPSQDRLDSARLSRLRLLLVDDDPLLLKSLCNTLEAEGHVVTTANDGVAGIAAFRAASARGETFAAVITDLGMPDVDGRKVASAIKAASPATPVIMLTGWGKRLMSEDDMPAHVDCLLSKPPKLRELRETLAQCCEPGRAQGAIEVSE